MIRNYIPVFIAYNTAQSIPTDCNSIIFINSGTSTAIIENVTLAPSQSFVIDGNENEYTNATLQINFTGGGQNNLVVVKKIF
jgi:hypothetical protein